MSGHSKWATIKHKKAAADAKRGKLFTKVIKEITVAAKSGGGNPDTNPRLRTAISTAKESNMPQDNIDRAIKKGTGELPGTVYEEVSYEGYGPQGVAVYVQCLTDNKNRTASEIRSIFDKNSGNMAGAGSVAWIFEKKGLLVVATGAISEDKLMDIVLSAGAEDMTTEDESYEVTCAAHDFEAVKKALAEQKITAGSAEITMLPKNRTKVGADHAKQVLRLIEALEDHDDVQNVYSNVDIPDEVLKDLA